MIAGIAYIAWFRRARAEDLGTVGAGMLMCAVASLVWILAAALVVPIVLGLTARQRARASRFLLP